MTYRLLKMLTVLLPTFLIGGFEYIRHEYLLSYMSMQVGNFYITLLTLVLSFLFSTWVFRTIRRMNMRLVEEQARRAVYEERERLARELHDGIAQTLFFLNVKLKQGAIEEARAAVSSIDNQVRQVIFNLRALPEEDAAFSKRIEKWIEKWSMLTGVEVIQAIELPDAFFSTSEEILLFGVMQEAFSNIRKHANAERVEFSLQATGQAGWQLSVRDNGVGIQTANMDFSKYGLSMMRERADQLGAVFRIHTLETGGTELQLTCPNRGEQR